MAETLREPRLLERGAMEAAEHGLGAGTSIGSRSRVRPLLRVRVVTLLPTMGPPAKADGLCGEEEMPRHRRNFLLAGNGAVWLVR